MPRWSGPTPPSSPPSTTDPARTAWCGRPIWVPTVIPNEIDFLSSRVRNYQYNPVWGALIDQFWIR
jgi:hypothetical protein